MHQFYRAKCIHAFPGISHRIYMISLVLYLQTIYLYINTICKLAIHRLSINQAIALSLWIFTQDYSIGNSIQCYPYNIFGSHPGTTTTHRQEQYLASDLLSITYFVSILHLVFSMVLPVIKHIMLSHNILPFLYNIVIPYHAA